MYLYNRRYRRALARNPACPPEVRLGIAACHFRLGDVAGATAAFERVLAMDPNNPDALTGLAVIRLNSSNVQQGLADGLQLLQRSFRKDPGNVGTLILLAHYFLLRSDYGEVETLARSALEAVETNSARVECHTLLARAAHAQQQYKLAAQHYYHAIKVDPNAPLPHLGLAQTFLAAGYTLNATTELTFALNSQPGFFDALKILGQLIGEDAARLKKTLELLQSAAARPEADADVHELLGELAGRAGDHASEYLCLLAILTPCECEYSALQYSVPKLIIKSLQGHDAHDPLFIMHANTAAGLCVHIIPVIFNCVVIIAPLSSVCDDACKQVWQGLADTPHELSVRSWIICNHTTTPSNCLSSNVASLFPRAFPCSSCVCMQIAQEKKALLINQLSST